MDTLSRARSISPELADWLEGVAQREFNFSGDDPNRHSSYNHQHLWKLESVADQHSEIDLAFRCRVVAYIFERWGERDPRNQASWRLHRGPAKPGEVDSVTLN